MSLKEIKDKLEIGLKPDAPYRQDNLPEFQQDEAACQEGAEPGNAPETEDARRDCDTTADDVPDPGTRKRRDSKTP